MAKKQISSEDLINALNGIDQTYDRLSRGGQQTLDDFFELAEKGFKQKDLDKFIKNLQWDFDRMNSDGQYYFNILKDAKI